MLKWRNRRIMNDILIPETRASRSSPRCSLTSSMLPAIYMGLDGLPSERVTVSVVMREEKLMLLVLAVQRLNDALRRLWLNRWISGRLATMQLARVVE